MFRVLLIEPEPARARLLSLALKGTAEVAIAGDEGVALAALRVAIPDLLLISEKLGLSKARSLCSRVRDEAAWKTVRLAVLVAGGANQADDEIAADLVLDARSAMRQVVEELTAALQQSPPATSEEAPAAGEMLPPPGTLSGSLTVLGLMDLTQALAQAGRSGLLRLWFRDRQGALVFDQGELVHALAGEATGTEAFGRLLVDAEGEPTASFRFDTLGAEDLFRIERTIDRPFQRLLLETTADLDESGAWQRPA
ncbi:MAG: DUF4388 domain-containing protein [Acidobacteriota bacterium]